MTRIDSFINEIFKSKPQEKRDAWISIFKENELGTVKELDELDDDMWNSLGLPGLIISQIKKGIDDINDSSLKDHEKTRIDDFLEDDKPQKEILEKMKFAPGSKKHQAALDYISTKATISNPPPTNAKSLTVKTALSQTLPLYHYPSRKDPMRKYYTFLVIGETGSGKTTLLDAFVNYLTGIQYTDSWRWKLVDENAFQNKPGSQSQTTEIKIYYVNDHRNTFNICIIDTPGFGDTEGIEKDNQTTKQFENLFKNIQKEVDYILVTSQASKSRLTPSTKYVYDCVQQLFGLDAAQRFMLMCTFADGDVPLVTKTLQNYLTFQEYFQFNNSALYIPSNLGTSQTKFYWKMAMDNVKSFETYVIQKNRLPLSLENSQKVLEFREHVLASVKSSTQFIQESFQKLAQVESILQTIKKDKEQIDSNANYKLPDQYETKVNTIRLPYPIQYCKNCLQLCCQSCMWPIESQISKCTYFIGGKNCPVCPGRCPIGAHMRMAEKSESYQSVVQVEDVKKKNAFESGQANLKQSEVLKKIYTDQAKDCLTQIMRFMKEIKTNLKMLQKIAMKPDLFSDDEFFMQMIQSEKDEKKLGWEKRIQQLEVMRENAKHIKAIENCENIQDLFPQYKHLFEGDLRIM